MRLGAHMPTAGGVWRALERGQTLGCEVVQIFVKNNLQWFGRLLAPEELDRYRQQQSGCSFHCIFGHAGYLINLGAPASAKRDQSLRSLIQEIEIATQLALPFIVLHPGSHLKQGEATGLKQVIAGLNEVLRATAHSPVRIALENTAGQGHCLGGRIEHMATIYDGVLNQRRLGLCLDTAHLFASGHNIRTPKGWNKVMNEVDQQVGLREILALHLNDSKADLGSRVDRHAGIGQGKIGRAAFRHIINDPRFRALPGCLETPKSPDLHEDIENLSILRSLRRSR